MPSHPAPPASPSFNETPKPAPNRANLPGFKDPAPSGKRRVAPEPASTPEPPPPASEQTPTPPARPQLRAPTPEEVENDPLVKTVLDVFEGEVKRVHPKHN
ncbi:MAG: hypothetical protein NXI07_08540 [bacterium]|nr:hypothetical protein [bacterium]